MQPRVLILRAPGINCDAETAFAFERAGGNVSVLHVGRLLEAPRTVAEYQILCIPGGFSHGDDISSGRILGMQFQHHLADVMQEFKAAGKLILGICNGFQVLVKSGLLLEDDATHGPPVTLAWNASRKFEDRWVQLAVDGTKCVFLAGIERMYLPVAHGEGQFVARDANVLQALAAQNQLALRYASLANGSKTSDVAQSDFATPLAYPDNPNGAQANVAGICDSTGRVFGLMPHPERHIERTQHPRWTRGEGSDPGDGSRIFQNAVAYFR